MPDQDAIFHVMEEALRHPDGRAVGGEPCVICQNPISASSHWSQRDRHVCSKRCNTNLRRRYGRGSTTIDPEQVAIATETYGPRPNPRTSGSRTFRTLNDPVQPFEWEGYGPIPGDVVERFGVVTRYEIVHPPAGYYTDRVILAIAENDEMYACGATPEGFYSSLVIGPYSATGRVLEGGSPHTFMNQGVWCEWRRERITDLHPDGVYHYSWDCYAAFPVGAPDYPKPLQSMRYRNEMARRKRVSAAAASAEVRAREAAIIERFDPRDIFIRDEWMCQICGSEVDRTLLYPDPLCASLDHVLALSNGGDHTPANTVLAHLGCNLIKGDR